MTEKLKGTILYFDFDKDLGTIEGDDSYYYIFGIDDVRGNVSSKTGTRVIFERYDKNPRLVNYVEPLNN